MTSVVDQAYGNTAILRFKTSGRIAGFYYDVTDEVFLRVHNDGNGPCLFYSLCQNSDCCLLPCPDGYKDLRWKASKWIATEFGLCSESDFEQFVDADGAFGDIGD